MMTLTIKQTEKKSVMDAIENLTTALEELGLAWDNNTEGVNLDDLAANKGYPFGESLEELFFDMMLWKEAVADEIELAK